MHIGPIIRPQPKNIVVVTDKFEYMGLYKSSTHLAEIYDTHCSFTLNGRDWSLVNNDYELLIYGEDLVKKQPIKSDGGSSSYYDLPLLGDTMKAIDERRVGDISYIKTEEIIQTIFKNNFSFGTLFKSLIRAQGVVDGAGKAGNDLEYEMNKVIYYANQIKELYGDRDE